MACAARYSSINQEKNQPLHAIGIWFEIDICQYLHAYFDETNISENDQVLIPSCDEKTLICVLEFLKQNSKGPTFNIRCIFEEMPYAVIAQNGCKNLKTHINQNRLKIYTETQQHSTVLNEKFGIQTSGTLVIPCTVYPDARRPAQSMLRSSGNPLFTVGIFGGPRLDKGSHRIASIVTLLRSLCAELEMPPAIEFLVQNPMARHAEDDGLYADLCNLPARKDSVSIRTINGGLSPADFKKHFCSSGVVLLPYDVAKHRHQGSGIVLDAVFSRIPIIHTAGIAFQEFLDHDNALAGNDDLELAALILKLALDPTMLDEGCANAFSYGQHKIQHPPDLEAHPVFTPTQDNSMSALTA